MRQEQLAQGIEGVFLDAMPGLPRRERFWATALARVPPARGSWTDGRLFSALARCARLELGRSLPREREQALVRNAHTAIKQHRRRAVAARLITRNVARRFMLARRTHAVAPAMARSETAGLG